MRTSESMSAIAPALLKAQQAIRFAAKDSKNPHFKNEYASLPSVIDAVKVALNDNGIVFIQSTSPSEAGFLSLTTRLMHESGEWIEDTASVPLPKNDPQGYGSAVTYARRYSLSAMLGLYQDDDDGNAASLPAADWTDAHIAMREADDLRTLQGIFGNCYKQASSADKTELKRTYDKRKSELEMKEAA